MILWTIKNKHVQYVRYIATSWSIFNPTLRRLGIYIFNSCSYWKYGGFLSHGVPLNHHPFLDGISGFSPFWKPPNSRIWAPHTPPACHFLETSEERSHRRWSVVWFSSVWNTNRNWITLNHHFWTLWIRLSGTISFASWLISGISKVSNVIWYV